LKILLLALFLTACSGPWRHGNRDGNVCVTTDFNADEDVVIFQSTQEWGTKSDGVVNLEVSYLNNDDLQKCDAVIHKSDLSQAKDQPIGLTEEPPYKGDTVFIYISNGLTASDNPDVNNAFYGTVLHELGHYLGANHSPYCLDTMYWKYNGKNYHLTDNDINQLWSPYPHYKYDDITYCQEDYEPKEN
jgi:hypothetical protein